MRDMFNHQLTVPSQWQMSILPNYFTKHEVRHGRFVGENQTVEESYDPMCATLSKGCYPVMVLDPSKLVDHDYGPAEARKLALAVNGTTGFDDWMIDEEVRRFSSPVIKLSDSSLQKMYYHSHCSMFNFQ